MSGPCGLIRSFDSHFTSSDGPDVTVTCSVEINVSTSACGFCKAEIQLYLKGNCQLI